MAAQPEPRVARRLFEGAGGSSVGAAPVPYAMIHHLCDTLVPNFLLQCNTQVDHLLSLRLGSSDSVRYEDEHLPSFDRSLEGVKSVARVEVWHAIAGLLDWNAVDTVSEALRGALERDSKAWAEYNQGLEKRRLLVQDYVLGFAISQVMQQYHGETVDGTVLSRFKAAVVERLERPPSAEAAPLQAQRARTNELFSGALAALSAHDPQHVVNFLLAEVEVRKGKSDLIGILGGFRRLTTTLHREEGLGAATQLLSLLTSILSTKRLNSELKNALCGAIVAVLPASEEASTRSIHLDYTPFDESLHHAHQRAIVLLRKPKHTPYAWPLYACTLCCSSTEAFSLSLSGSLDIAYKHLKEKDRDRHKHVIVQQIHCILKSVFARCQEGKIDMDIDSLLQGVTQHLFFAKKKGSGLGEGAAADAAVDLVMTMANFKPDFTMDKVVLSLISDLSLPELSAIGLRVLGRLFRLIDQQQDAPKLHSDKRVLLRTPPKRKEDVIAPGSASIHRQPVVSNGLGTKIVLDIEKYEARLGEMIAPVFHQCHATLGHLVLTNPVIGKRTLADLMPKDKWPLVRLFIHLLRCLPSARPSSVSVLHFFSLLMPYNLHLSPEIRVEAETVLVRSVARHEFRTETFEAVSAYVTSIPDLHAQPRVHCLSLLLSLLQVVQRLDSSSLSKTPIDGSFAKCVPRIEAAGTMALVSVQPNVRFIGYSILEVTREICRSLSGTETGALCSIEILQQGLHNVLARSYHDSWHNAVRVFRPSLSITKLEHFADLSLLDVLHRTSPASEQFRWIRCMTELLKLFPLLNPSVAGLVWSDCFARVSQLCPNGTPPSEGEAALMWRNYSVISSALAMSSQIHTALGNDKAISEFYHGLANLLSSGAELHRIVAQLAMGRSNSAAWDAMMEHLAPVEDEVYKYSGASGKRQREGEVIRAEIGNIYRHMCESMAPKSLAYASPYVRKRIEIFLSESATFLSASGNELRLELQALRFSAAVVARVSMDDFAQWSPNLRYDSNLRRRLFVLFLSLAEVGPGSEKRHQEEQVLIDIISSRFPEGAEQEVTIPTETLQFQMRARATAALAAIPSLLQGPAWEGMCAVDGQVFGWINMCIQNNDKEISVIGSSALRALLGSTNCFESVISFAYSGNSAISDAHFLALADALCSKTLPEKSCVILVLALIKFGSARRRVRRAARTLVGLALNANDEIPEIANQPVEAGGNALDIFLRQRELVASSLASLYNNLTMEVVDECLTRHMGASDPVTVRHIFSVLIPWAKNFRLDDLSVSMRSSVLRRFVALTSLHGASHPDCTEALWSSVCWSSMNVAVILDFFLRFGKEILGVSPQNDPSDVKSQLKAVQRATYFLGRSSPLTFVDLLSKELQCSTVSQLIDKQGITGFVESHAGVLSSADQRQHPKPASVVDRAIMRFDVAIVLLAEVELSLVANEAILKHLAIFTHFALLELDRDGTLVSAAKRLIINMLLFLISRLDRDSDERLVIRCQNLIQSLGWQRGRFWDHDDLSLHVQLQHWDVPLSKDLEVLDSILTSETPSVAALSQVVNALLDCFSNAIPHFPSMLCSISIEWATHCPARQFAVRSHHIARATLQWNQSFSHELSNPSWPSCVEVFLALESLSDVLAEPSPDGVSFAVEVLRTLRAIVLQWPPRKLILLPQLFWGCVALLYTPFVHLYLHSISVLHLLLLRLDLKDLLTHNSLEAAFPKVWEGVSHAHREFPGLHKLLLRGVVSPISMRHSLRMLSELADMRCPSVLDPSPSPRLLICVLAHLPYLTLWTTQSDCQSKYHASACMKLAKACYLNGLNGLSDFFDKAGVSPFPSLQAFAEEMSGPFFQSWRPEDNPIILKFFTQILERGSPSLHIPVMLMCEFLLRGFNMQGPRVTHFLFPRLMRVLASHLNGPCWEEARKVLDVLVSALSSAPPITYDMPDNTNRRQSKAIFGNDPAKGTMRALRAFNQAMDACPPPATDMDRKRIVRRGRGQRRMSSSKDGKAISFEEFYSHDLLVPKTAGAKEAVGDTRQLLAQTEAKLRDLLEAYEAEGWGEQSAWEEGLSADIDLDFTEALHILSQHDAGESSDQSSIGT